MRFVELTVCSKYEPDFTAFVNPATIEKVLPAWEKSKKEFGARCRSIVWFTGLNGGLYPCTEEPREIFESINSEGVPA